MTASAGQAAQRAEAGVRHSRLSLPAGELQLAQCGEDQRQTVVLVHGGYGSWMQWIANLEPLGRDCRVLAPDLPGFGASWDPGHCLPPDAQARVILDMLDALGLASAHLAGFSFGSLVAIHAALQSPRRIASLTLVNPPGVGPRSVDALAIPSRISALARTQGKRAAVASNLRELMLCQHQLIDDALVDQVADSIARTRYVTRALSQQSQTLDLLGRLACPVQVLLGERDPFHSNDLPGRRRDINAALGRAAVRIIPGAAHWLQYDQPDQFNRAVIEFIRTASRQAV